MKITLSQKQWNDLAKLSKLSTKNKPKKKKSNQSNQSNPCWNNYEMLGTKEKNGKIVPNCVPKKTSSNSSNSSNSTDPLPLELIKGIEIEKEHTSNPQIAKKIALDHLKEIPDYYSRLINMESNYKKENKQK